MILFLLFKIICLTAKKESKGTEEKSMLKYVKTYSFDFFDYVITDIVVKTLADSSKTFHYHLRNNLID